MSTRIQLHPDLIQNRKQALVQMCLAAVAGYVDAYGLIKFKTYLSFMSGNTTQTGSLLAGGNLLNAKLAITAICSFFFGVFLGTVVGQSRRLTLSAMPVVPVASGLLMFLLLEQTVGLGNLVSVLLLGSIMGYMNTASSLVGNQPLSPDFITGTLNHMAVHLASALFSKYPSDAQAPWDTHLRRYLVLLIVWSSFIFGAISGTIAFKYLTNFSLCFPILLLTGLAVAQYAGRADHQKPT